jgi:universal stress protein family protein
MTLEDPQGPFVLCYDGSEDAERAIRIAPVLLGRGRAARVLYAYKPTERSLGVAQAVTGGRIDAPAIVMGQRGLSGLKSALLGSVSREVVNAYHRPVVVV